MDYNGDFVTSKLISKMEFQYLPIDGKYLKSQGLSVRDLGIKLKEIQKFWADNNYKISEDEINSIISK